MLCNSTARKTRPQGLSVQTLRRSGQKYVNRRQRTHEPFFQLNIQEFGEVKVNLAQFLIGNSALIIRKTEYLETPNAPMTIQFWTMPAIRSLNVTSREAVDILFRNHALMPRGIIEGLISAKKYRERATDLYRSFHELLVVYSGKI